MKTRGFSSFLVLALVDEWCYVSFALPEKRTFYTLYLCHVARYTFYMTTDAHRYRHQEVEKKWREAWENVRLDTPDVLQATRPFYNLMMFPYPSAEGLHVGNMYAFTGSDIYGRFKRMQGYDTFQPIGLDGFGIHSENYAFKVGTHPVDQAKVSERRFYNQLHTIGAMYDWSRTVETYDPDYYQWTQWLFVQMFKHGLCYRGKAQVNWCPSCKTVLADEQVMKKHQIGNTRHGIEEPSIPVIPTSPSVIPAKAGIQPKKTLDPRSCPEDDNPGVDVCERCGNIVEKRLLEQWFFKITAYAEKLLQNSKALDWSAKVKLAQQQWIGKKEGITIKFGPIDVFTTRPDTIYGATFVVLSPRHPLAGKVPKVVNPATKTEIPVFVDEYVLDTVGTGAIMGVPAYDERDRAFAKKMGMPIVRSKLTKEVFGENMVTYHLRDWLISRQRYWGPPIPMIYCETCEKSKKGERPDMPGWYPVPEKDLPVLLPRIDDYKPGDDGIAPLAKHKEFYETVCPGCGGKAVRETDVSDTFLDSSWYFLRYPSLDKLGQLGKFDKRKNLPWDSAITKRWLPVHMYTGGAEHSVLHLLYSRFVWMALRDWGYLDFSAKGGPASGWDEPFTTFYAHGLVIKDGAKMSKSKGNVVNPDDYISRYGADALRLYLMFTGPYDQGGDFRDSAMEGMSRWIQRVWRLAQKSIAHFVKSAQLAQLDKSSDLSQHSSPSSAKVKKALHRAIKKVGEDIERRRYNTAIAAMMELVNAVGEEQGVMGAEDLKDFLKILAPFAPYMTEELYQMINTSQDTFSKSDSIHFQPWPVYDPKLLVQDTGEIAVQVNGKLRDTIVVESQKSKVQSDIEKAARLSQKVARHLEGKVVKKVIFVPARLINFVV